MKETEALKRLRDLEDLQSTEAILEYARGSYQRSVDNFNALDSKASTLAGFTAVVLALAGGLWAEHEQQVGPTLAVVHALSLVVQLLYSASVLALATAFLFCLLTLRARNSVTPPLTEDVVAYYLSLGAPETRRRVLLKKLVEALQAAEMSRTTNNQAKSAQLQRATNFMFWALAFGIAGYLLQTAHAFGHFGGAP